MVVCDLHSLLQNDGVILMLMMEYFNTAFVKKILLTVVRQMNLQATGS